MHCFLLKLVNERADNEEELRSRLSGYMATFRRNMGINENDGANLRIANAFGLLYAAGRLAQEYGVLPRTWKCGPATQWVYNNCLVHPERYQPLRDQLDEIAAGPAVAVLQTGMQLPVDVATNADVFVQSTSTHREIMIRPRALHTVLPNLGRADMQREAAAYAVPEKGHKTVKRTLGAGGAIERMYVFRLPLVNGDAD